MEKEGYDKFLSENITCKKSNRSKVNKLIFFSWCKENCNKSSISDRIDWLQKNEAYIRAKDHKENFQNNPTFRLINPTKTKIDTISKII